MGKVLKKLTAVLTAGLLLTNGLNVSPVMMVAAQDELPEETETVDQEPAEETETVDQEPAEETEAVDKESAEETEASEKITPPKESEVPAETNVPEDKESEGAATSGTEEETIVSEEEKTESEEVSLITLDPVSYNGLTISVSYYSDAFGGKKVEMKTGDPGEVESAALEGLGQYKAVDITFADEEGNPVQPEDGKSVFVVLKADGMENADNAKVAHVEGDGKISFLEDADISASNPVTKPVKTGETTTTVTVPEETEQVLVNDYKDESYFDFEVQEKVIEVPAVIGYRYVLKSKVVRTAGSNTKLGKNAGKSPARVQYYLEEEPYVIREGYTKIVRVRVPVLKTRKVLVGSHYETKVVNEAYTYEKTEDVYEDVEYSDVEAAFTADSFSVYALVVVDEDGGIDFDETFGENHIAVKAPAGAFDAGTVMKIETVDDPDVLVNALKALDENQTYAFYAVDISFWKGETEVEPRLPVEVVWESVNIEEGDQLVHIDDENSADLVSATVEDNKAVFTAREFSTYTTTRLDTFELGDKVVFNPSELNGRVTTLTSGELASTHPEFEGFTYVDATYEKDGSIQPNKVVYLGAFIYREFDDDGSQIGDDKVFIYYRTDAFADNDLIVQLAEDETIHLNYETTPLAITYNVVYNGTTYHMANADEAAALRTALGSDADALIFEGPASVKPGTDYAEGVKVEIPRGYTGQIRYNNTTQSPQVGVEPTHTLDGAHKIITRDGDLNLSHSYDISTSQPMTVTLTLTKRTSFTFDASYFLRTVYTGGYYNNQDANYGDYRISDTINARIYGDGTLGTSGNNKGKKTFTADSVSWTFTTQNKKDSGKNQTGDQWMVDALEINGTTIEIPYANPGDNLPVSKTTTLPSGTVVTVSLTNIVNQRDNYTGTTRTNYRRTYTISVTNCYEDIVITGGNIVDIDVSTEIIPEVLENVTYAFNGYSTSDRAYSGTGFGWQEWGVGEPIAVGNNQSVSGSRNWNMYGFNQTNNNAMRFSIPTGYYNPEIAFESTEGTDLISNVSLGNGLSRGPKTNGYYPINGNPNNGYYYFRVTNYTNNGNVALLRIRAHLMRYGVDYDKGDISVDATIPAYDYGGYYDDAHEQLQGYNVVDNPSIVIDKSVPTAEGYVFLYYTIQGDSSGTRYAPSQKVPLETVAQFGSYDDTKKEFVIPLVAHWEEKSEESPINVKAHIILDDVELETVTTQVPLNSAVYIDIDSDTMHEVMDKYNWQLFYDEEDSDPFINGVNEENNEVTLRLYSKFYVYHSSTGTLELHTTKECEVGTGDQRTIGTLNITALTNSGYLYGGYYADYAGAHENNSVSGTNLVKAAADYNNSEETLSTQDIIALSGRQGVEIATVGTPYNPASEADHVGYWEFDSAFDATNLKSSTTDWFSDRGSKDTAVLQTGGNGTEVTVARAGIYYLKEVPNSYLRPTHMTTYQRYDRYLRDFILFSTTDDTNYLEDSGFLIGSTYTPKEVFTDQLTISFGPNYDETVTNGEVKVDVTNASSNAGGFVMAYRLFHLADESNKDYSDIIGNTIFKPYWITPDGITVTGASMRRETVKDVNEDGLIKVDSADGEIKFRDIAAIISAFKQ